MKKKKSNLLMMEKKISVALLLFIFFQSLGIGLSRAQSTEEPRLTVEFKKTPFIEVLSYIKQHTHYDFLYNNDEMKKIPVVTRDFKNVLVSVILQECLKGTGYTFRISHNVIVIKKEIRMNQDLREVVLRGMVLDDKNVSLPGATVMVKGTKLGVSTDNQGKFILSLPGVDTIRLIVSFVGMESQEVVVTNFQKEIVVKMKSDTKEMEEVVITGYGNIRKSSFTGNSVSVSREELLKVSKSNVIRALEIFDPSFRIKDNNEWGSDPNALPEMQIRGQSSIGVKDLDRSPLSKSTLKNNPNLPIFILDGFEVTIQKVYDMNPHRIENITILKDASATALYGSRSANGVVVITTVAPKMGQLRVAYDLVGVVEMPNLNDYNLMNAREKLEAELLGGLYGNFPYGASNEYTRNMQEYYAKLVNVERGVNTYWLSKPLQTAFNHQHNLTFDGGTKNIRYSLGLSYANNNGVMKESYRNTTGIAFRFDYLFDKVQVSNRISYDIEKSQESPYGYFSQYTELLPYDEYKDENGKYTKALRVWDSGAWAKPNPLYESTLGSYAQSKYNALTEQLMINWYILPWWQIKGELNVTQNLSKGETFVHPESGLLNQDNMDDQTIRGSLSKQNGESTKFEVNVTTSFHQSINKHDINLMLGLNVATENDFSGSSDYRGFPSGEFTSVTYAKEVVNKPMERDEKTRRLGMLGQLDYTYNNVYFCNIFVRSDGSSAFGSDRRFAPFGSIGFGVNIHNYEWMQNQAFIDELRVRGSYGRTGKISFPPYAAIPTHQVDVNRWYMTGAGTSLMSTRGNPDLTWEKTDKLDVGIEAALLNKRLSLKYSYYHQMTNDLITDVKLPSSTGFSSFKSNMGKVLNEGFEVSLQGILARTRDLHLSAFFRISHNVNTIKEISNALKEYNDKINEYYNNSDNDLSRVLTKYEEGQSTTAEFGMKSLGIDPAIGKELFLYRDGSVGYAWKASEMVAIGDTEPWGNGNFGLNCTYKGFSLSTSFTFEFGGDTYNETLRDKVENADFTKNLDRRALSERWQKSGDISRYKDIQDRDIATFPTSRFMQRNNFVEWNSITLEYEFAESWLQKFGCERLMIGVTGNDLWRVSTVKAERGLGYPYSNSVSFSLNVSF